MKKIILASLLMMSCISTAEMKLYTISFDSVLVDQQNFIINFLHDDEAFPDYTNNVNLNKWTTDSDIITTINDGPATVGDSFWSIGESTWDVFEIKFDTGNGLNHKLNIISGPTSHGPENTFNLSSGSVDAGLRCG